MPRQPPARLLLPVLTSKRLYSYSVPSVGTNSGVAATQTYSYDALNRIQVAEEKISNVTSWKQRFNYDIYGNRTFDAANTTTLGTCPAAVCNPAIGTARNQITSSGYLYDAAGSLTQDAAGQRFAYDTENRQKSFFAASNGTGTPSATYVYDGEGRRVRKVGGNEDTIFVYDAAGRLAAEYQIIEAAQDDDPPRVSYLTNDHLGSPRIVTDANGAVVSRKDFAAFGDETITSDRTPALGYPATGPDIRQDYTGYQKDGESGLEYAQVRYYPHTTWAIYVRVACPRFLFADRHSRGKPAFLI